MEPIKTNSKHDMKQLKIKKYVSFSSSFFEHTSGGFVVSN